MATQQSFESILDTPATEVERPKPLPAGTYSCIVRGLPEYGESSQKKTPFVRFTLAVQAAGDDVDTDELQEIGGIADKTIRNTFYTTPDALFRLTDFLDPYPDVSVQVIMLAGFLPYLTDSLIVSAQHAGIKDPIARLRRI